MNRKLKIQANSATFVLSKYPDFSKGSKRNTLKAIRRYVREALIIYILSDDLEHNQTDIKNKFNEIYDEVVKEKGCYIFGYNELFGEYFSFSRAIASYALDFSGKMDDSGVSRIVQSLEEEKIIIREIKREGRGTAPTYNRLNPDLSTFLKIFDLLKSLPNPWNEGIYSPFSQTLLNSPYGKKVISFENVKKELDFIAGEEIVNEDINFILKIVKSSPSALYILLKHHNKEKISHLVRKGDQSLFTRTIGMMMSSMGNDIWHGDFNSKYPLVYSISIDQNENKNEKVRLRIDENKSKISLYFPGKNQK